MMALFFKGSKITSSFCHSLLIPLCTHLPTCSHPHREEREKYIRAKYIDKEFLLDLPESDQTISEVGGAGGCGVTLLIQTS